MITIWQAFQLFAAILIAWWAIKKLCLHYFIKYLEYKRFCMKCSLTKESRDVVVNSDWKISVKEDDNIPIFLCNTCKEEEFPGELGETAEKTGFLIRKKIKENCTSGLSG